jgi:hypothetical protein
VEVEVEVAAVTGKWTVTTTVTTKRVATLGPG